MRNWFMQNNGFEVAAQQLARPALSVETMQVGLAADINAGRF